MVTRLMTRPRHTTQTHGKRPQFGGQLAAGQQLGRYQVLAELASGGMAVVHVASAHGAAGFERLVALKVLHSHLATEEEFIKMFLDEARLAAGIRHPNVVSTIDISDSIETGYFLVMEYVEGDHLGALLSAAHKRGHRIPLPVVTRIMIDALAGLGAAHELRDASGKPLQLVHRDVSPHNVMVGSDGVARLTDFGVAKAEDRLTQTRHGEVKGKLSYMAPEQASSGVSDRRSDLFSVGIMLWEAVTGRRLFRADSVSATLSKLLANKIAPPSAVDPELAPLDALLRKALAHEPSARFQTAEEFSDAIDATARQLGGVASWRTVADAVSDYASEKLARERKLITAAKQALPHTNRVPTQADGPRRMPTVSFEAEPLSKAEPSGIFSNLTAARRPRKTRSGEAAAIPVSIEFQSNAESNRDLLLVPADHAISPPNGVRSVIPLSSESLSPAAGARPQGRATTADDAVTSNAHAARRLSREIAELQAARASRRGPLALGAVVLAIIGTVVSLRLGVREAPVPPAIFDDGRPEEARALEMTGEEQPAHLVAPMPPDTSPEDRAARVSTAEHAAVKATNEATQRRRTTAARPTRARPVAHRPKRVRKTGTQAGEARVERSTRLLPNPYKQ
jgi:serine/threonine protein kinase